MPNSRRNDNVRFNWVYVFSGVLCWLHSVQTMELRLKLWLFFGYTKNCVISLISNAFYSKSRNSLTFFGTWNARVVFAKFKNQMPSDTRLLFLSKSLKSVISFECFPKWIHLRRMAAHKPSKQYHTKFKIE